MPICCPFLFYVGGSDLHSFSFFSVNSPGWVVCTSCMQSHERWHWRGSPCSHWCHSLWWCTDPDGDQRWLPLCLAWERDKQREMGQTSRTTATADCHVSDGGAEKMKGKNIPKNICCIFHFLYTKQSRTFLFLFCIRDISFLFWQLRRSVREREGSCLSGVDEGLSDWDHKRTSRFIAIRRKCIPD